MDCKGLDRLEKLRKLNAENSWINRDLYRLLYKEDLYVSAYERLKSNPGNMTPGSDGSTLDGFSIETIRKIILQMRNESFQFLPARRVSIPKASGGKRSLSIAPPRDKIVQEVMRMILESIYDSPENPTFLNNSHGFRANRGTHSALAEIRKWQNVKWFIEGDIKGCFDNIDHHTLIQLLRKRIYDEKFLNLVWKALKAGYLEFKNASPITSLSGTPQGSIVSPLLANIYLHELDLFVKGLQDNIKKESNPSRKPNPVYRKVSRQIEMLRRHQDSDQGMIKELKKSLLSIPSSDPQDENFARMSYIRYADDWIIGLEGPIERAKEIRDKISKFLSSVLKLTLSLEKTFIRHATDEEAFFLGTLITKKDPKVARIQRVIRNGKSFTKRTTGWQLDMKFPLERITKRLAVAGFCTPEGEPIHNNKWVNLDPIDIVSGFNAILVGIRNYYSFVDNRRSLQKIQYILQHSCAKTLATKQRLGTRRKVFRLYGRNLRVSVTHPNGKTVSKGLNLTTDWQAHPQNFLNNSESIDSLNLYRLKFSRSRLGHVCAICGDPSRIVEMHHIRHVRKRGKHLKGFTLQMSLINRKQIPVCAEHHDAIHSGKLDNFDLKSSAR